jgi:signal transduction histidine kinase
MTLRARLALGILAIAAVLVFPLFLTLRSLDRLHQATRDLREQELESSLLLGTIRTGTEDLRRGEDIVVTLRDTTAGPPLGAMGGAIDTLRTTATSLQRLWPGEPVRQIQVDIRDVTAIGRVEYALVSAANVAKADTLSNDGMRPAIARLERRIADAERALRRRTQERVEVAADATEEAWSFAAWSLGLAILLASGIAVWLTRTISGPLRDLERGMEAVASGEFEHPLGFAPERRDEFGRLAASYSSMASQLAALDKLKAEFVSVASHELKTPLNVILGYLSLMDEGVYGELSAKQREVLQTIESQCQTLGRLVKQLLDVSRFEAGGGKLEPRWMQLCPFLDELESSFQVLARQRGVEFEVTRADALPTQVLWDQDRINEVLGNLLSNAFKFTDRFGRVELAVEAVDGAILMEVRDTGAGIPEAQVPHIFQKFYQADNQSAAASKGTGLGLAIAKEIVEAHNGTICVDSTPGIGTTFSITLPVKVVVKRRRTPPRLLVEGVA